MRFAAVAALLALPPLCAYAEEERAHDDTCLMLAAHCLARGNGNFFLYYKISEEKVLLRAGDRLEYDVYLHPDQPVAKGGVDIQLDHGSVRDSNARDGDGRRAHGDALLDAAQGRWLRRSIDLSHLAGRRTERWDLHCEGDPAGLYVQFVDNVELARADGTRVSVYRDGRPQRDEIDWREGYGKDARLAVVPRARVTDGGDLKALVDAELTLLRRRSLADEARAEWELVAALLEREGRADLLEHVQAARAELPDPDTFAGSAEDYLAAIHRAEHRLGHAHPVMQKYTGHLVGHAHIDFQWLWEWPETIQVCKDTFGQALRFMDEFPDFTFSQSSAALYLATEEHHPELFARIRERVKEGRWEIVGGRWCEGDTNLISGESHARHFLYGQRYLRERFGVSATVGWEPDTFGHAWTMPQILRLGGIDTYYFCRGGKGKPLFHWEGPDGSRVLAFEEPALPGGWYNSDLGPRQWHELLEFQGITGSRDLLWVYGVGNHGGGPTRENLETALGWHRKGTLPRAKFSTATAFFQALRAGPLKDLPVVRGELNPVFEGTYTTHGDMKRWNRDVESLTVAAETAAALASRHGFAVPRAEFVQTWRDALWNHHHDTLPGTSIHASYRLSRTMYERGIASSRRILGEAARALAAQSGAARPGDVFVLNTLGWPREAVVQIAARAGLPDGPLVAVDPAGNARAIQRTAEGELVFVARGLPAFGFRVYRIEAGPAAEPIGVEGGTVRVPAFELTIHPATGALTRLVAKALGREVLAGPANDLRVYAEAPEGMSAWTIGALREARRPAVSDRLEVVERGPVRVRLRVKRAFDLSPWTQEVIVYRDLDRVEFVLDVDWRQIGTAERGGAFLKAHFPFALEKSRARYAIPFGDLERPADGREVVALQWADLGTADGGVALLNDGKHGHSARGSELVLSLLRCSDDPDPEPDLGRHVIRYALYPHAGSVHEARVPQRGFEFGNAPVALWVEQAGTGTLASEHSFLGVEGALPTALKLAEDGDEWVLRMYESQGRPGTAVVRAAAKATEVNFVEDPVGEVDAGAIPLRGYEVKTVKVGR